MNNFVNLQWKRRSNPSPVLEYVSLTVGGYEIPAMFVSVQAVRRFWSIYRDCLVGGWRPTQSQISEALREIDLWFPIVPPRFN